MSPLPEFELMLGNYDRQVFRNPSQICRTRSNFEKITGLGNPVMYLCNPWVLLEMYPHIKIEGGLIAASNVFLIHAGMFEGYIEQHLSQSHVDEEQLLYEIVLKRLLTKYQDQRTILFGGRKNYVEQQQVLTPSILQVLTDFLEFTRSDIIEKFNDECAARMSQFSAEFQDLENFDHRIYVDSAISVMYLAVLNVRRDKGIQASLQALKKLINL